MADEEEIVKRFRKIADDVRNIKTGSDGNPNYYDDIRKALDDTSAENQLRKELMAFQYFQNDASVHPLTCEHNGNHKLVASFGILDPKVFLVCPHCGYAQIEYPKDLVLEHYRERKTNGC